MLPGKKYTPEDVLKILRKRFWVVVVPWAVIAAATAVAARKLPDLYRSVATIQVIKPQVPDTVVRSMSNTSFQDRLNASSATILSRTRLEELIREFNLYPVQRQSGMVMEQVAGLMRNDIRVTPGRGDTFQVAYIGRNPVTVMKVAERLAGQFKDESIKEGGRRAEGTNTFVEALVDEKKRQLEAVEAKLREYRLRYSGELPTQLGANIQAMQGYDSRLNGLAQAINQDNFNKSQLERQIETVETSPDPIALAGAEARPGMGTAAQRLVTLRAELKHMEEVRGLKPEHREMRAKAAEIAQAQKEAEAEGALIPLSAATGASPAEAARASLLNRLRADLKTVTDRIAANQAEEKRTLQNKQTLQAKIDRGPVHDAQLITVTRDYETLKELYNKLVTTREQSSMAVNLEHRQIGEQFNLVDQARIPERPFSPDRFMINLFGVLGGLAVGLALVMFLEYRDATFKADYEVAGILSLPVLAVVPLMRSAAEKRADFRRRLLVNLGLGSAVAACGAVLAYSFLFLR